MILAEALDIHRQKVPESLQPFQAHMDQRFTEMKAVLEKDYGIKVSASLTYPLHHCFLCASCIRLILFYYQLIRGR